MVKKKKLNELYKEVFLAKYSSKNIFTIQSSSVKNKNPPNLFLKDIDCLITSSLSSRSSLRSHFRKIVVGLNSGLISELDNKAEIVVAVQPHNNIAVAEYVFDREWIQELASYSLGLGLTLVKLESRDTMPLLEKRVSIFTSRKIFSWDKKKQMYSNCCEVDKLISINLSFSDDNLKPDAITKIMGIKPDKVSVKGQMLNSVSDRKSCTGTWLISCEDYRDGHKSLHGALNKSLNDLYGYRKRIFQVTQKFNCESNLTIAFNTSFKSNKFEHYRFSPYLFKALVPFGVDLTLSIWMP